MLFLKIKLNKLNLFLCKYIERNEASEIFKGFKKKHLDIKLYNKVTVIK